jgi:hypothetical protein
LQRQIKSFIFHGDLDTKEIPLNELYHCKQTNKKEYINQRLILSFSTKRAKKDKLTREKNIQKLQQDIKTDKLSKKHLKFKQYAKFITIDNSCNTKLYLNQDKLKSEALLDGIKGFITNNTNLSHQKIITHYKNLSFIEQAFKISKTDLQIRPIRHRLKNRIKAHILISFIAYAIYKEFDRRLKQYKHISKDKDNLNFSYDLIMELIKHMQAIDTNDAYYIFEFDKYQKQIYEAIFKNNLS